LVINSQFSTGDFLELFEIVQISWAAGDLFEMPKVIEAHDVHGRPIRKHCIHAPPPGLGEIEGFLDEEVDLRSRMARTPERKDGQSFVFDPSASHLLLGEVAEGHGRARLVPEAFESGDCGQCVGFIEVEHEIEVRRKSRMAMKHDGNATYHEVADIGPVEGTKDLSESASRHAVIVA